MNLYEAFLQNRGDTDHWIADRDGQLSYQELANGLENHWAIKALGSLPSGSLILVSHCQSREFLQLLLYASQKEWILVPFYERSTAHEWKRTVDTLGVNAWLDLKSRESKLLHDQVLHKIDEPGVIFQTSGTTGEPKFIFMSQSNMLMNARRAQEKQEISQRSLCYGTLTLTHSGGLTMQVLPTLLKGGSIFIEDRFQPQTAVNFINQFEPTHFILVPSHYRLLKRKALLEKLNLKNKPLILTGSEPIPSGFFQDIEDCGGQPLGVYGLTEMGPFLATTTSTQTPPEESISCLGVFEDGFTGQVDASGEILVKGVGYNPRVDPADLSLQSDLDPQGWLPTGDYGVQENGVFYFSNRQSGWVNLAGYKINCSEVRAKINEYPGIMNCRVYAVADPLWNERPQAQITTEDTRFDLDGLKRFLRQHLNPLKIPHQIDIVDEIEATSIGKVKT